MMSRLLGMFTSPSPNNTKAKAVTASPAVGAMPTNAGDVNPPAIPPYDGSSSMTLSSNVRSSVAASPGFVRSPAANANQVDMVQWYRRKWQVSEQDNSRLKSLLGSRPPPQISKGGRGKNKMTLFNLPNVEDVSNGVQLRHLTTATIWPTHKFLFFQGPWTVYNVRTPHPFAKDVMDAVMLSPELDGFENDYYRDVALPVVSAKMCNLRGNMIGRCGVTFKSEYSFL